MSKLIFSILILFNCIFIFGQNEKKGLDNNPILAQEESDYFNNHFSYLKNKIDFTDKKAAFISIDLDIDIHSKNDFFKFYSARKNDTNVWDIMVLDAQQKNNSAGFDLIILINRKATDLSSKQIDKLISRLKISEDNKPINLYNLGLDDNPTLTTYEAEYFNNSKANKNSYDFSHKKVGFFFGSNGSKYQTKSDYFDLVKNRLGNNSTGSMDVIIRLSDSEKYESGGYDFIVISWSKTLVTSVKSGMINKLKENHTQRE